MDAARMVGAGPYPGMRGASIVTSLRVLVTTCRLAMPDGCQATLAGTLIGPSRQASHIPPTSVAPARERTMRRHTTFLGSPLSRNSMLVPHVVAVSLAVALTCVARSEPVSTMPAAVGCWVPAVASQSPVRRPAAAAQAAA